MSVYKRSHFTAAVHAGDTKKLKNLLRSSKLSSIPGLSVSRLVTLALRHGQQKVANLLLKSKFKLKNENNHSANTSLHYAAKLGDLKLVKLLIRNGMDINGRGTFGMTPLHVTAIYNKHQVMEYLIQNGAIHSLEGTEGILKGYTPLHVATELNFHKCVRLLIKYDNSTVNPKNQDAIHPIHIAVMLRHFKITQILLPHINNINVTFKDEFFPRFYGNPNHCARYYEDYTLLLCAISFTSLKITNLLVNHGANVQIKTALGKTALIMAAETSNPEIVKLLLTQSKVVDSVNDFDALGRNALHSIFYNYDSQRCVYSKTEFYSSAMKLEIIKMLMDAGIDMNAPMQVTYNNLPTTPLSLAVEYGFMDIVRYLLYFTDTDLKQINRQMLETAQMFDNLIHPEILQDFEYVQNYKSGFKEIGYDLITAVLRIHLIGIPVDQDMLNLVMTEPVHDMDINRSQYAEFLQIIIKPIEEMVNKMEQEKVVHDCKISLRRLVTCDMKSLVKFARVQEVRDLLMRIDSYEDEYFYFHRILKSRLEYAVKKSKLIDQSLDIICNLFENILGYDICEMLVDFLNDDDMNYLVN